MLLKKTMIAAAVSAALGFTTVASAASFEAPAQQPAVSPWYVSGLGGGVFAEKLKVKNPDPTIGTTTLDFKNGYNGGLAVGYKDGNYRYEGELLYMQSKKKTFMGNTPDENATGRNKVYAAMANLYYDITNSTIYPYVGAGVGVARVKTHIEDGGNDPQPLNASSTEFAYQGIAGIGAKVSDNVNLFVDYRYFGTTNGKVTGSDVAPGEKENFRASTVNAGVTVHFG